MKHKPTHPATAPKPPQNSADDHHPFFSELLAAVSPFVACLDASLLSDDKSRRVITRLLMVLVEVCRLRNAVREDLRDIVLCKDSRRSVL